MEKIYLHKNDLPPEVSFTESVALDTEAMGLNPHRDRLCLLQLSQGDGICHLVQFEPEAQFAAPRVRELLADGSVMKIFHYARFDVALLARTFGILPQNIYCTKVASRLVRTYTDRHGLRDLCRELLGVEISKTEQSSDWGAPELRPEQQKYAAHDVLHLHRLKAVLDQMLVRENRTYLAQACFDFLPHRALLDLMGWDGQDILGYNV